ncbi:MAG: hypothetical protein M0000_07250 [Actinomycetota bacterium]|nr:hypothetical protein [Actinomycetota bacterium]
MQRTGRQLRVGDAVRHAKSSPSPTDAPRELGSMTGTIIKVFPNANSGARKQGSKPRGKVQVRWASGSIATHDSHMIVAIDENS